MATWNPWDEELRRQQMQAMALGLTPQSSGGAPVMQSATAEDYAAAKRNFDAQNAQMNQASRRANALRQGAQGSLSGRTVGSTNLYMGPNMGDIAQFAAGQIGGAILDRQAIKAADDIAAGRAEAAEAQGRIDAINAANAAAQYEAEFEQEQAGLDLSRRRLGADVSQNLWSRENAAADRASREGTAAADRASREGIAQAGVDAQRERATGTTTWEPVAGQPTTTMEYGGLNYAINPDGTRGELVDVSQRVPLDTTATGSGPTADKVAIRQDADRRRETGEVAQDAITAVNLRCRICNASCLQINWVALFRRSPRQN